MKRLFAILMFTLGSIALSAQNIKVEAPSTVGMDEQFNIVFVIDGADGKPHDFSWPGSPDFQIVWGPQSGSSTSVSMINGKVTKSSTYTYTYILQAKSSGSFTLPAATAKLKGADISSRAVSVKVVSGGSSSGSSQSSASSQGSGSSGSGRASSATDIPADDLFLKFSLSKSKAVIGEPLTATLVLYKRVNIAGFEGAKFPTFNGFWSQEVDSPNNIEFHRENIGENLYDAALIRKYILVPQQSGRLTIDPAELVCLVNVRKPNRGRGSIFDSFFEDDYTTIRKRLTTKPVYFDVEALPAGSPASFGGGVGKYSISASLSTDSLKTHDAASIVVTVSGRGNVSLLEAPKLHLPADFELYDVKISEKTDKGGTSGSKVFEYPFIPRSYGDFEIAPVEYSYYDVDSHKYVTVSTSALNLHVEKGQNEGNGDNMSAPLLVADRNGVKNIGNDIRFISIAMPLFKTKGGFFVDGIAYWLCVVAILLCGACVYLLMRRRAEMKADVAGLRKRSASRMAIKRLKTAADYLSQNLYGAFYEELHKSLLGYMADRFSLSMEDLDKDSISGKLSEAGVDESVALAYTSLLDACEFARYSPSAGQGAMESHYQDAVNVITSIDSQMKSKKSPALHAGAVIVAVFALSVSNTELYASADSLQVSGNVPVGMDQSWSAGVDAYNEGRWNDAVRMWQNIADEGVKSSELYYNLAGAWFKSGDYAHAILNYERSLQLDPSNRDARFNLDFVHSLIRDRIEPVPDFILKSWAKSLSYMADADAWAVWSLVFLALFAALVIVFLRSSEPKWKRTGFYSAIVALLLSLAAFGFARWQSAIFADKSAAIVMSPVSSVKSAPSTTSSAKDLFVLHEGTKVKILDSVDEWANIELEDGRQGWILSETLELI